jgi:hypothetical protein
VTHPAAVRALRDLHDGKADKATYAFNGNSYEAVRKPSAPKRDENGSRSIVQTNTATRQAREIRVVDGATRSRAHIGMEEFFSGRCEIELPADVLGAWLEQHRFELPDQCDEMSLSVASLAHKIGALMDTAPVYINPVGNQPPDPAVPATCHQEGGQEFCSEVWCKPHGLHNWLRLAKDRGYFKARLIMHGSKNYDALRADPFGMNMALARGQAFGNGQYFGLTPHATKDYNDGSRYAYGTYVLCMHLVVPQQGWQHRARSMGAYSSVHDAEVGKLYKTISFGSPLAEMDNALVVHDVQMAVVLGLARAFDKRRGWLLRA